MTERFETFTVLISKLSRSIKRIKSEEEFLENFAEVCSVAIAPEDVVV